MKARGLSQQLPFPQPLYPSPTVLSPSILVLPYWFYLLVLIDHCIQLFVTLWTIAHQAPWSMGLSRQEYWSGLLFPSSGDLPNPGIKPRSPALQADSLLSEPPGKPSIS